MGRVGSILWANVIGMDICKRIERYFRLRKVSNYRCRYPDGLLQLLADVCCENHCRHWRGTFNGTDLVLSILCKR